MQTIEKMYCPVCESHSESFLPFGLNPRQKAQCPVCKSLERHRLIWLYFRERTSLFRSNLKMLHIAPEGQLSKKFKEQPNIDYLSADLMLPSAMVKMDITNIQYPDDTFDVIYANHVLEHIPDDIKAMRELCRVLKPTGWAILQVPIFQHKTLEDPGVKAPEEREKVFGQHDHVRKYGNDGVYKARLEKAGFNVNVDSYVRTLGPELIARYGLMPQEDIYYCTK